jgi:predicted DNA-binding antitoxin AbrB/MazE fold protein
LQNGWKHCACVVPRRRRSRTGCSVREVPLVQAQRLRMSWTSLAVENEQQTAERHWMIQQIDAVYENGVLRPTQPLRLSEHERFRVTVIPEVDEDLLDHDFNASGDELDSSVTLEQVQAVMSKIGGSMDSAIDELRGEY